MVKFSVAAICMFFCVAISLHSHATSHIKQQQRLSAYSKEGKLPVSRDCVESSDLLVRMISNTNHSTVLAIPLLFSEYTSNFCNPALCNLSSYQQKISLSLLLIYPNHYFW